MLPDNSSLAVFSMPIVHTQYRYMTSSNPVQKSFTITCTNQTTAFMTRSSATAERQRVS